MKAPPFAPTPDRAVTAMIAAAGILPYELVVDLGCGDAKLLIAACQAPRVRAWGIEYDEGVWRRAKEAVQSAGLEGRIELTLASYFDVDLEDADVVFTYLNQDHMAALKHKFASELGEGARVVSHCFPIDGWQPSAVVSAVPGNRIFVYGRERMA